MDETQRSIREVGGSAERGGGQVQSQQREPSILPAKQVVFPTRQPLSNVSRCTFSEPHSSHIVSTSPH